MTALVWDEPGAREYQVGIDRGVLYIPDEDGVAWNGLSSVEETPGMEIKEFYYLGVKYLQYIAPGTFSATLKAFTYPDKFELACGVKNYGTGMRVYDQPPSEFGLSYRTKIGNDIAGVDAAYRIHLLYNLLANPDSTSFDTLGDSVSPAEFSWSLTGRPVEGSELGNRPAAHISIDSSEISPEALVTIEATLYGTEDDGPALLSPDDLLAIITP